MLIKDVFVGLRDRLVKFSPDGDRVGNGHGPKQ